MPLETGRCFPAMKFVHGLPLGNFVFKSLKANQPLAQPLPWRIALHHSWML
jgi:hypothetical protein